MERSASTLLPLYSFSVVALEITSTRIYSYLGVQRDASIALSLAMLGLGLGAVLSIRLPGRLLKHHLIALVLALSFPATAFAVRLGIPLVGFAIATVVSFILSGFLLSSAYASLTESRTGWGYAADLSGAAIACVLIPQALDRLGPINVICTVGAPAAVATAILYPKRSAGFAIGGVTALLNIGLVLVGVFERVPDLTLEQVIRAKGSKGADVIQSEWSSVGRLDVIPVQDWIYLIYTDYLSPALLVRSSPTLHPELSFSVMVYDALKPLRVLILGAGGGATVRVAKEIGGAIQIDGVELNPSIENVLSRWRSVTGPIFDQPGVRLFIDDARGFLMDRTDEYDLIELTLAMTGTQQARNLAAIESHLYTREAMRLYLARLTATGVVTFVVDRPALALRLMLTALDALESKGLARRDALDHIAVMRNCRGGMYGYLVAVGRSPLSEAVRTRFVTVESASPVWVPGMPMTGPAKQIVDEGVSALIDATPQAIVPISDDSPYFFEFEKDVGRRVRDFSSLMWVAGFALFLAMGFVIERTVTSGRTFVRPGLIAACIGVGFMCVEVSLIQRMLMFAGGPMAGLSFVLFVLLFWCAVGSLVVAKRLRRLERGLGIACALGTVGIAFTLLLVRDPGWLEGISSPLLRRAALAFSLAPIGVALGTVFPTLLAQQTEDRSKRIASLWAINGAASVTGGVVAGMLIRLSGTTAPLILAGVVYVLATVLAPRAVGRVL